MDDVSSSSSGGSGISSSGSGISSSGDSGGTVANASSSGEEQAIARLGLVVDQSTDLYEITTGRDQMLLRLG